MKEVDKGTFSRHDCSMGNNNTVSMNRSMNILSKYLLIKISWSETPMEECNWSTLFCPPLIAYNKQQKPTKYENIPYAIF
jgi:hypothetical protein